MHAELAYLFRHSLLRDAAYQLQLPGDRARLHGQAVEVLESLFGGVPPQAPLRGGRCSPHPTDPFAEDICGHLERFLATAAEDPDARSRLLSKFCLYLRRVASNADERFQFPAALAAYERLGLEFGALTGRPVADLLRASASASYAFLPAKALELTGVALELARRSGDRKGEGRALNELGRLLVLEGRHAEARPHYEAALDLVRETGDRSGVALALSGLGMVAFRDSQFDRSIQLLEESMKLHHDEGDAALEGACLSNLAGIYSESGQHEKAERLFREAVALNQRIGNLGSLGFVYGNYASLLEETGRREEAEAAHLRALEIHGQTGNYEQAGVAGSFLAGLCSRAGRNAEAIQYYRQAIQNHTRAGNLKWEGASRARMAVLLLKAGHAQEAEREFSLGLALISRDPQKGLPERLSDEMNAARAISLPSSS